MQAPSLVSLDASFNAIADLAGLEKLTRLQDLSLFCNRVAAADCLTGLLNLELLSLGPPPMALAQEVQEKAPCIVDERPVDIQRGAGHAKICQPSAPIIA